MHARLTDVIGKTQIFLISNILLLWWLLQYPSRVVLYAFSVWVGTFSVVTVGQFWLLANNLFDSRQARRLFSLIGLAAVLGGVSGGTFTFLVVRLIGARHLMLACGLLVGVTWFVVRLLRKYEQPRAFAAASARLRTSQEGMQECAQRLEKSLSELRNARAQLVQSEELASLGRLLASVAHEINTPIGSINSNNDLLVRSVSRLRDYTGHLPTSPEKEKIRQVLGVLANIGEVDRIACQRVIDILRDLRNLARLEQAERKPADIHESLGNTLKLVQWQFGERIRVEKDYGDLPRVECHPNQLNQVFMNLLVNAGEAIEGEGFIRITTRRDAGRVVIKISDAGKGIPPEHLEKILDPGFTTKPAGSGIGLGLAITSKIVHDHGGTIQVESQVGKGTTFAVTLPVR